MFRSTRKVWLIDEVDNLRNQDTDTRGTLIAILNSGFKYTGCISRMAKQGDGNYAEESFSTYGPKAFAGLNKLTDTVTDRCFQLQMVKSAKRKPRITVSWVNGMAAVLRRKLEEWMRSESAPTMRKQYEKVSSGEGLASLQRYDARFQDITEPLAIIAHVADYEAGYEPRITKALLAGLPHVMGRRKPTTEQIPLVIRDLEQVVLGEKESVFIPSQTLFEYLRSAGVWWVESATGVASFFKTVGLSPRNTGSVRGYEFTREWFQALDFSIRQGATPLMERVSDT